MNHSDSGTQLVLDPDVLSEIRFFERTRREFAAGCAPWHLACAGSMIVSVKKFVICNSFSRFISISNSIKFSLRQLIYSIIA